MNQKTFNLSAAAIILILAIFNPFDWGYDFFLIVRWTVFIVSAWAAAVYYDAKKNSLVVVFSIIAITYNPFIPFYLDRARWILLDILSLVFISYQIFNLKLECRKAHQ